MSKKRTHSTLHPWLNATTVHSKQVKAVGYGAKNVPTRPVAYVSDVERVHVPELQDHLLIQKGYLPKYSGLPLDHFVSSLNLTTAERRRLKAKARYWNR